MPDWDKRQLAELLQLASTHRMRRWGRRAGRQPLAWAARTLLTVVAVRHSMRALRRPGAFCSSHVAPPMPRPRGKPMALPLAGSCRCACRWPGPSNLRTGPQPSTPSISPRSRLSCRLSAPRSSPRHAEIRACMPRHASGPTPASRKRWARLRAAHPAPRGARRSSWSGGACRSSWSASCWRTAGAAPDEHDTRRRPPAVLKAARGSCRASATKQRPGRRPYTELPVRNPCDLGMQSSSTAHYYTRCPPSTYAWLSACLWRRTRGRHGDPTLFCPDPSGLRTAQQHPVHCGPGHAQIASPGALGPPAIFKMPCERSARVTGVQLLPARSGLSLSLPAALAV